MNGRHCMTAALAAGLIVVAVPSGAKEGADQYPNGSENWMAGALPPPGNYFINYLGWYGGELKDGSGDAARLPDGRGGTARGDVDAVFNALRFIKVTDLSLLGASWALHAIVPVVYQDADFAALGSDSVAGIGDIVVDPLILGWHFGEWHFVFGLDIYLSTGKYSDDGNPSNDIGANYNSIEPAFAFTYLGQNGVEVSAKLMYNIKAENDDTNYQSGDEFHMDYLVGYHMGPWAFGVSGYYLKQTSDDEVDGRTVAEIPGLWSRGRKGEVFAAGPSVNYKASNGMMFIGQWQHEFDAENRFEGDKVWFKLVAPF